MEINKKLFYNAISLIKAYKDVIVLRDSPVEGCLDILYGPKCPDRFMPNCVNKMTIRLGGSRIDLFDDSPVEKLGDPILVFVNRVKDVLQNTQTCVFKEGCINGIQVGVEKSDTMIYPMFSLINDIYEEMSNRIKFIRDFEKVTLLKTDYAYMVSELSRFVSKDETRHFMMGICFDFVRGGKDFIHMVATDGRKLCLLKQAASHTEYSAESKKGEWIIPPMYLHIPDSEYSSARIKFFGERIGQVSISAEDYHFESVFNCIDGQFPNYNKVIPEITEKTQWFTLCAASLRMTIDSVKSLLGRSGILYLGAENPESMNITIADSNQTLEIEGTASRPMRLSFAWEHLSACLFDGLALTKFWLNGSNCAILSHEAKAVKGLTLNVTKLFMPTGDDSHKEDDEFRIPKIKEQSEDTVKNSETVPEEETGQDFEGYDQEE